MNDGLRPYLNYKDSALHWLGKIPKHWTEKRAKYFFREIDERSTTGQEPLMSVSHKTGVTLRKSNVTMFRAESNIGHKICRPGDLAINTLWAWMAALGVSRQMGLVSPAYGVYRQRDETNLHPEFIDFLLRTPQYSAEYRCRSTGITTSRLRLYPIDFLCIPLVQPPREEQELIVRYLRQQDVRIRKFIRNRRRLIEVLNEQKHAIINRAVTRGLNPAVSFKPSGIDWLGEMPAHWRNGRIKTEMDNLNTRRIPLSGTDRGRMTQRLYDYYGASSVIDKVEDYLFDDDLLLIAEDGANLVLRNLPLAIIARGKFWVNNHAHILKPRHGSLEYFAALLEQIDYSRWITGAAQPKLTQDRLMAVRIPVPPDSEQAEIADWIAEHTRELSSGIRTAEREIDLIREYRARLIADVVTGKLDVRHMAPPPGSPELEELAGIEADGSLDDESVEEDADLVEETSDADT